MMKMKTIFFNVVIVYILVLTANVILGMEKEPNELIIGKTDVYVNGRIYNLSSRGSLQLKTDGFLNDDILINYDEDNNNIKLTHPNTNEMGMIINFKNYYVGSIKKIIRMNCMLMYMDFMRK